MVGMEKLDVGNAGGIASTARITTEHEVAADGPVHYATGRTRLAWGAVVAGALTALALLLLSYSLAFAVDVPAYRGGAYGFGAGLWAVIASAVAFYFGGAVVVYLSPRSEMQTGLLHGILAWVLAVNLAMLTTAFGGLRGFAPWDLARASIAVPSGTMTTDMVTGPAWGAFLSLLVGLAAAAIGGIVTRRLISEGKTLGDMVHMR